jgi:uncharacterized protein YjcR
VAIRSELPALTKDQIAQAAELYAKGWSLKLIASQLGVAPNTVKNTDCTSCSSRASCSRRRAESMPCQLVARQDGGTAMRGLLPAPAARYHLVFDGQNDHQDEQQL